MQDSGDQEERKDSRESLQNSESESGGDAGPSFTRPGVVERRVWRNIFVVIAIAVLSAAVLADLKFVFGLVVGGMLALVNYRWLHSSVRGALATGEKKAPAGTTMKFVFRWVIVAAAIYLASLTGLVEPIAMLIGLFAP
ncbi:MAG TPA: ATP synthase subunit I, partial [Blastocatellia bacterium]|nr:ATP synthase subunit I [Blastocatellia bacterium]